MAKQAKKKTTKEKKESFDKLVKVFLSPKPKKVNMKITISNITPDILVKANFNRDGDKFWKGKFSFTLQKEGDQYVFRDVMPKSATLASLSNYINQQIQPPEK